MTSPTSYEQALALAVELQAAGKAAPSATAVSVVARMSQQTISVRERSAEAAKTAIRQLWAFVDPFDGAAVQDFTVKAAQLMAAAQSATARAAAAAQAQQLAAIGVRSTSVPTDPVDVRAPKVQISDGSAELVHHKVTVGYENAPKVTVTVRDASTEEIFNRPARDYRYRVSQNASPAEARTASEARIDSLVDDNNMLAQRLAEHEALAQAQDLDARVIGYRRVIHPELSRGGSCGMCIAASDRLYKIATLKAIHANCNCTVAAVTRDFDPADELNAVDLKRFYGDAQGNTVAALKRTRYQVDEHGELAAVLIPKSRHQARADARTKTSANRG